MTDQDEPRVIPGFLRDHRNRPATGIDPGSVIFGDLPFQPTTPDDYGLRPASAQSLVDATSNDDALLLKGIEQVARELERLGEAMVADAKSARDLAVQMADADVAEAEHTKAVLLEDAAKHRADAMALIDDRRARANRVASALSETRELLRSRTDAAKAITGRQS